MDVGGGGGGEREGLIKPDLCHGAFMAVGEAVGGEALSAVSARL